MIDTEAITEEPSLEQEDGEQAPNPQQETQQSQAPESPQESETPQSQMQEQAGADDEQSQHPQGNDKDALFNGISYIDLITTVVVIWALAMLVITRSMLSIKIFGLSIVLVFIVEHFKPNDK